MTKTIKEGFLAFTFGEGWRAEKYDGHPDYRDKIERLDQTRGVDFVAADDIQCLFIEVKDFRGYRIDLRGKLSSGKLCDDIALKVRDSIAGIIGAHRRSSNPDTWAPFAASLANRNKHLKIILWLEDDTSRYSLQWQATASVLTKVLRQKLAWLTTRIIVMNLQTCGGVPRGISVCNLPRN